MSPPLPATLIAGFGSAAKAPVIEALLRHKPVDEQWALIAPAGLLGVPRVQGAPGLVVQTVAPGCPCCTGLTPFSAGLVALLRRLRDTAVTRLLIEGGAEGHIATIRQLLAKPELSPHVALAHATAVINPEWLEQGEGSAAHAALMELAGSADSLIAHPWENAEPMQPTQSSNNTAADFGQWAASFAPPRPWAPLSGGALPAQFAQLLLPPRVPVGGGAA